MVLDITIFKMEQNTLDSLKMGILMEKENSMMRKIFAWRQGSGRMEIWYNRDLKSRLDLRIW